MNITHPPVTHEDDRGAIVDLLALLPSGAPTSVTFLTCNPGASRGDHYHLASTEYIYVLSGHLSAGTQHPDGHVTWRDLYPGYLLVNDPGESHVLIAAAHSLIVSLTIGPKHRGDTYPSRVPRPIAAATPPTAL